MSYFVFKVASYEAVCLMNLHSTLINSHNGWGNCVKEIRHERLSYIDDVTAKGASCGSFNIQLYHVLWLHHEVLWMFIRHYKTLQETTSGSCVTRFSFVCQSEWGLSSSVCKPVKCSEKQKNFKWKYFTT